MSKQAWGIAIAVLVCGLLFSSAASARQTADSITVTGAVLGPAPTGTYVQFFSGNSVPYGNGTPFKQITFSGGNNYHFTGIEGAGGNCRLTPADGGISCTAAPEPTLPNIWLNTTISGTLPSVVTGTVIYGDNSTGTFTAPVTDGPPAVYAGGCCGVVVKGTSLQISTSKQDPLLPPVLQFSLSPGSDWHVTAISTAGGTCSVTSDGGGSCTFAKPAYGFVVNATFSGRRPTFLGGQLGYAHNVTIPWSYATPCRCTKLSAGITSVKKHGRKLGFILKWKLDCSTGSSRNIAANGCLGTLGVDQPRLPRGLRLRQANGQGWEGGRITIHCHQHGGCARTTTGQKEFAMAGPVAARAGATVNFHLRLHCPSYGGAGGTRSTEDLTLTFDKHGNLDHHRSHLGRLG